MFKAGGRRLIRGFFVIAVILTFIIIIYTPQRMNPPPKQVFGWEINVTRETKIYVVPENDTSLISGKEICRSNTKLLIVVHSAVENSAQRTAIRETWGSYNISSIRLGFLLGWSANTTLQAGVEEESLGYQDVIQEDFVDSYNNLTLKSVMMLKWFLHKCPSPRFLMKSDDDMFVHIENLHSFISKIKGGNVLAGSLICKAKPILDSRNKWYSPRYLYPKPYYPNYLSGTAYIMSRDVAQKLYNAALSTPIFHLEDVYITGLCASKAGVRPRNQPGFSLHHLGTGCSPGMITNHRLSASQLHRAWQQRLNCTAQPKPTATKPVAKNPCV